MKDERHERICFWLAILASAAFTLLFAFAMHNMLRYLVTKGGQQGSERVPAMIWSFYAVVLALTSVTAVLFACLSANPMQYFDIVSSYIKGEDDLVYISALEGLHSVLLFLFFSTLTMMMFHILLGLEVLYGMRLAEIEKKK